jgi:uncharacterized protein (DUF1501 family)
MKPRADRRGFLRASVAALAARPLARSLGGLASAGASLALAAPAAPPAYNRLLVLIELKGGNDGLNTVVPYADPAYYALRPKLAIARDRVVQLTDRVGLHPALAGLRDAFVAGRLALLQGVGYPAPNLSHFRSIEIWDTAAASDQYLADGWLARTFASSAAPASFAADGVVIGSNDMGPLAGRGTRALALANTDQFLRRARLAHTGAPLGNRALAHILKTENDVVEAATRLDASRTLVTEFPATAFGSVVRTACHVAASPAGVACMRLTLNGFDTHTGQAATHARLLGELAAGLEALERGLREIGRWDDTLVVTYAEFGRRPRENVSGGTDHGTSSAHFVLGGRVTGGLHGAMPELARLRGDGNPEFTLDYRRVYATALESWWGVPSAPVLNGRYAPLPLVRA